ncbi:hypothetical protein CFC21_026304 [Triticum aestivum]|uniref:Phytocyanin domain-containing protein n=1 Tax=Triticum aestivum TaxID=4565 RepID=A0A9R1EKB8_WHEAT|nr:hypothetical protein CFC21_026304 [Triticum aestivum]
MAASENHSSRPWQRVAVLSTASAASTTVGEPGGAWDLSTNTTLGRSSSELPNQRSDRLQVLTLRHTMSLKSARQTTILAALPIRHPPQSGNDVVTLTATGTRYFICGFPGHCAGGMKVKIDVMSGSSSMSPAPASGPSASNAPPPTPVSAATNVEATGFGLAVLLAIAGLMA